MPSFETDQVACEALKLESRQPANLLTDHHTLTRVFFILTLLASSR